MPSLPASPFLKFLAATCLVATPLFASSANAQTRNPQLAIGAAGAGLHPVKTVGHGRAVPDRDPDSDHFHEPIYATPPGYRYVYVRGYRIVSPRHAGMKPAVKKVRVASPKSHKKKRIVRRGCVTDIDYGQYESCR
ncbi:MAG: hypothetical protein AB7K04_14875 [Pseudorhodoplanes sp.]